MPFLKIGLNESFSVYLTSSAISSSGSVFIVIDESAVIVLFVAFSSFRIKIGFAVFCVIVKLIYQFAEMVEQTTYFRSYSWIVFQCNNSACFGSFFNSIRNKFRWILLQQRLTHNAFTIILQWRNWLIVGKLMNRGF